MNWLFFDDPLLFLKAPDSAFLGARADYPFTPWLLRYGGEFARPLAIATLLGAIAFPATFLLMKRVRHFAGRWRMGIVAFGLPLLAAGLAAFHQTLAHPAVMVGLLLASVARGDAADLVLPYADAFKFALRRGELSIAQIVVAEPRSGAGARDAVTRRVGKLYEEGMPGYELVFDQRPWRVYRRTDVR